MRSSATDSAISNGGAQRGGSAKGPLTIGLDERRSHFAGFDDEDRVFRIVKRLGDAEPGQASFDEHVPAFCAVLVHRVGRSVDAHKKPSLHKLGYYIERLRFYDRIDFNVR